MPTDLAITMEDRPGAIAELFEALDEAGITVDAICGDISEGQDIDHILVEDVEAARRIVEGTGSTIRRERDVVVVALDDEPTSFAQAARQVSDLGVNVDLIYLATRSRLVIGTSDEGTVPRELQERLGGAPLRWGSLTEREREVAELVAEGLSNSQIAERLVLSVRTVKTHLEHIFQKLGVTSRVQLAVEFTRQPGQR